MTTARAIIRNALTFGLNRLSPGEAEDADLFARCLDALNDVVDEVNGGKLGLFREVFTVSTPITGTTGTLGTTWAGILPGEEIIGATVQYGGQDVPLFIGPPSVYENIAIKTIRTIPAGIYQDGAATVFIYPAASGQTITIRTKEVVADFADLDTAYVMPKGYQSAWSALLAKKMALVLIGGIPPNVESDARNARRRLTMMNISPAILGSDPGAGPVTRILRGY